MAYDASQLAREFIVSMDTGAFDGKVFVEAKKLSLEELAIVAELLELRVKDRVQS
jgi:hypothetical protein